ncbi:MAG: hypothetical protein HRU11_11690, partial [Parvularculaceae bacterium]|nr:hypothetical protein [Parvularculaceae bacterium]
MAWRAGIGGLAFGLTTGGVALGAPPNATILSGDDLLILEARTERLLLGEGLVGHDIGDDVCVLLPDLMVALEFAITVTEVQAEGWFYSEKSTFFYNFDA